MKSLALLVASDMVLQQSGQSGTMREPWPWDALPRAWFPILCAGQHSGFFLPACTELVHDDARPRWIHMGLDVIQL